MKTASLDDVEAHLREFVERAGREPVLILQEGRPVAALVAVDDGDEDADRLALSLSPRFRQIIEEARERVHETGGLSHEEFWRQVEARYGDDQLEPGRAES